MDFYLCGCSKTRLCSVNQEDRALGAACEQDFLTCVLPSAFAEEHDSYSWIPVPGLPVEPFATNPGYSLCIHWIPPPNSLSPCVSLNRVEYR